MSGKWRRNVTSQVVVLFMLSGNFIDKIGLCREWKGGEAINCIYIYPPIAGTG